MNHGIIFVKSLAKVPHITSAQGCDAHSQLSFGGAAQLVDVGVGRQVYRCGPTAQQTYMQMHGRPNFDDAADSLKKKGDLLVEIETCETTFEKKHGKSVIVLLSFKKRTV